MPTKKRKFKTSSDHRKKSGWKRLILGNERFEIASPRDDVHGGGRNDRFAPPPSEDLCLGTLRAHFTNIVDRTCRILLKSGTHQESLLLCTLFNKQVKKPAALLHKELLCFRWLNRSSLGSEDSLCDTLGLQGCAKHRVVRWTWTQQSLVVICSRFVEPASLVQRRT